MANIIDYIKWRGDLDFNGSPFNEVDNLILSKLTYMPFDGLMEVDEVISIEALAKRYLDNRKEASVGLLLRGEFEDMIQSMAKSIRFGNILVNDYTNIVDENQEMQFAAMVFQIEKVTGYIAFRGTDDTLIGWKEDFKMSFMDTVPAQTQGLEYLKGAIKSNRFKRYYVGGHSKGGNLAVYAATHLNSKYQRRLIRVFNNDGPGFRRCVTQEAGYQSIREKVITLIPQSSLVGMLLEHEETYDVIKSNQQGLYQHDGFSWEVLGNCFVHLTDVDDDSRIMDMTIKKTLNNMTDQQREAFTNAFFEILKVNQSKTLSEVNAKGIKNIFEMVKTYTGLDKTTRKALTDTLSLLFSEGIKSYWEVRRKK